MNFKNYKDVLTKNFSFINYHFYFIDILRVLSAVLIVMYHYRDLFRNEQSNALGLTFDNVGTLSLFKSMPWITSYGSYAVMLFWAISGWVFAHMYCDSKGISLRLFFIRRFSRLYPLHFLTLIITALLLVVAYFEDIDLWPGNHSLYNFLRQIFFVSGWGGDIYSFNKPIWSVSVEIAVYAIYYFIVKLFGVNFLNSFVAFLLSAVFLLFTGSLIASSSVFFFGSVIAYLIYRIVVEAPSIFKWWVPLASIIPMLLTIYIDEFYFELPLTLYLGPICWGIIFLLCYLESFVVADLSYLAWFGNLTYSSYLIHMPLMMLIVFLFKLNFISPIWFSYNISLALFLLVVLVLSFFCYKFYELPLHVFIKKLDSRFNVEN